MHSRVVRVVIARGTLEVIVQNPLISRNTLWGPLATRRIYFHVIFLRQTRGF